MHYVIILNKLKYNIWFYLIYILIKTNLFSLNNNIISNAN